MAEQSTRGIPAEQWAWASENLPIACVDVLLLRRGDSGAVTHVGLIRRHSPFGEVWCHIGGRQERLESIADAARRALAETVSPVADVELAPEAYLVQEYFPTPRPGAGHDPRKHAVAVCFTATVPAGRAVDPRGEALALDWFPVDALPDPMWPGTGRMIERALADERPRDELATYESLSAREISRDQLMWQTPALAMTAMAFLLTLAFDDGPVWRRALAAGLSTFVAVVSTQLMAKHSAGAIADADRLHEIERARGMREVHAPPTRATGDTRPQGLWAWFASKRSRQWWLVSLMVFGAVSFAMFLFSLGQTIDWLLRS